MNALIDQKVETVQTPEAPRTAAKLPQLDGLLRDMFLRNDPELGFVNGTTKHVFASSRPAAEWANSVIVYAALSLTRAPPRTGRPGKSQKGRRLQPANERQCRTLPGTT